MATYGRDEKGEYKIRDDGSKVYRDSSNTKYFPTDYGGTAGWSTGSSSSSSGSSSSGSSSKKSSSSSSSSSKSSGGSSGSSGYKITVDAKGNIYKDGRYLDLYNPTVLKALQNDPQGINALKQARAIKSGGGGSVDPFSSASALKGYLADLQRRREQGVAQGYDVSHIDKEYQRAYNAGVERGYWGGGAVDGATGGGGGGSAGGSGNLPSQAPSTPEEMMQYFLPSQAPSTPEEMMQYLWQLGLLNQTLNQTPYPEIPEYRPLEPPVLSFSEARKRAEAQLDPLYADLLKRVSTQSAQNLEQSGLFGSLYGEKLRQDAALNVENNRAADVAALANQLVNKSEEEARYLESQNYQRWRDYVGDLVNQYSANRAARQDQTALLAQMLTYLTGREDAAFNRWLQEEQLGLQKDQWGFQKGQAEWERSGFPSQYEYQKALAKLEASLKPKSSGSSGSSSTPYGNLDKTTTKNLNISYYMDQIDNYIAQSQRGFTNSYDAYKAIVEKIEADKEQLLLGGLSINDIEKLKEYAKKQVGLSDNKNQNSSSGIDLEALLQP